MLIKLLVCPLGCSSKQSHHTAHQQASYRSWYLRRLGFPVSLSTLCTLDTSLNVALRFQDMIRLIEANPAETVPIVDTVFEFQDAVKAYGYLKSQKHVGKVVIRVSN